MDDRLKEIEQKEEKALLQAQRNIEKRMEKQFKDLLEGDFHDPLGFIGESLKRKSHTIMELNQRLAEKDSIIRALKKGKSEQIIEPKIGESQSHILELPPSDTYERLEAVTKKTTGMKEDVRKKKLQHEEKFQGFVVFLIKCLRQFSQAPKSSATVNISEEDFKELAEKAKQWDLYANDRQRYEKQEIGRVGFQDHDGIQLKKVLQKLKKEKGEKLFVKVFQALDLKKEWDNYIREYRMKANNYDAIVELKRSINSKTQKQWEDQKLKVLLDQIENSLVYFNVPERQMKMFQKMSQGYSKMVNFSQQYQFHKKKMEEERAKIEEELTKNEQKRNEQFIQLVKFVAKELYDQLLSFLKRHNQGNDEYFMQQRQITKFNKKIEEIIQNNRWKQLKFLLKEDISQKLYHISKRTVFFTRQTNLLNCNLKI